MNNNKKKILFIATSPLYMEKGSSLRMFSILKMLSETYKIDLITYSLGREFMLNNVDIYRTPRWFQPALPVGIPTVSKIILDFLVLTTAVRLSLMNHYDVIHCEDFEGLGVGYVIKFFNKKAKLVYNLHNRILDNLGLKKRSPLFEPLLLGLEEVFMKKTDKIILNWAKYINDALFNDKEKFLYYDPIETGVEEIQLPAEQFLIYSGNFEDYQGLQNFIPVFAGINEKIKLVLVGSFSLKIEKLIKELNIEDRVILTGRLSVKQTNYLIKNSIAGVSPRLRGSAMKVIHYFFWNKPVIAYNTNSSSELIQDGINGFLYSSGEELTEKLTKILNPDIREGLKKGIEATHKLIEDSWDKKRFMSKYIT
jgi:glycosyltransferase involved in cell wall biosynthesis